MRTLRVRGVSLDNLHETDHSALNSENLTEDDLIKKQDIVAALIQAGEKICLAVVEILGFEQDGSKIKTTEVNMDDLEADEDKYTVYGQILEMKPAPTTMVDLDTKNWLWTGHYMRFGGGLEGRQTAATSRQYVVRIPGKLIYPLGPTITSTPSIWMKGEGNIPLQTWSITNLELNEILEVAWDALNPDSEEIISNIELLPSVAQSKLPYCDHLGMYQPSTT
jgi:hypothetical protein